jgi:hypothetical protein
MFSQNLMRTSALLKQMRIVRVPHLLRDAPLQLLRSRLFRDARLLHRQPHCQGNAVRHVSHRFHRRVKRGGRVLVRGGEPAENTRSSEEHFVGHTPGFARQHTKSDAREDEHVVALPDEPGQLLYRVQSFPTRIGTMPQHASMAERRTVFPWRDRFAWYAVRAYRQARSIVWPPRLIRPRSPGPLRVAQQCQWRLNLRPQSQRAAHSTPMKSRRGWPADLPV